MRQLFKTRYTKKDPRIQSWYGVSPMYREILVTYPLGMETPFLRRDLISMESFMEDNFEEYLIFEPYNPEKDETPKTALERIAYPGISYEEVIL